MAAKKEQRYRDYTGSIVVIIDAPTNSDRPELVRVRRLKDGEDYNHERWLLEEVS